MAARLGLLLYWVGCAGAAVMVAVGVYVFASLPQNRDAVIVFVVLAAISWAVGRGARFVLAGR